MYIHHSVSQLRFAWLRFRFLWCRFLSFMSIYSIPLLSVRLLVRRQKKTYLYRNMNFSRLLLQIEILFFCERVYLVTLIIQIYCPLIFQSGYNIFIVYQNEYFVMFLFAISFFFSLSIRWSLAILDFFVNLFLVLTSCFPYIFLPIHITNGCCHSC